MSAGKKGSVLFIYRPQVSKYYNIRGLLQNCAFKRYLQNYLIEDRNVDAVNKENHC